STRTDERGVLGTQLGDERSRPSALAEQDCTRFGRALEGKPVKLQWIALRADPLERDPALVFSPQSVLSSLHRRLHVGVLDERGKRDPDCPSLPRDPLRETGIVGASAPGKMISGQTHSALRPL